MNVLRWIAVPFMFPIGMILGNMLGMLNGFIASDKAGAGIIMVKIICGVMSAFGATCLPAAVAPSNKKTVQKVCVWLLLAITALGLILTFSNNLYSGWELAGYLSGVIGSVGGAIWAMQTEIFD